MIEDEYTDGDELLADLGAQPRQRSREPAPRSAPERAVRYAPMTGDTFEGLRTRLMEPGRAIATPFGSLNALCRGQGRRKGIALGWHAVLAAKSGFGKSIAAVNFAASAFLAGERVAFHSLEMDWDENAVRLLAVLARVDLGKLEPGDWFDRNTYERALREWKRLEREGGGLITSNAEPLRGLSQVADSITRRTEVDGCTLHIVDYLQLAGSVSSGASDEILARVAKASDTIRGRAKALKVATLGLSQFNRRMSAEPGRPCKEGLMGGSPLENDSELVLLIDHSRTYVDDLGWNTWLLVDKNRHGPGGQKHDIPIRVDKRTLHMRERLPDEITDAELSQAVPTRSRAA